jgi:EAL domain-containing protein (putative c-di-GMP-specific phosphodiesterase class I)
VIETAIADAILIDEVGIETGVLGRFRATSLYRPIFSLVDGQLEMVAVEASAGIEFAGSRATMDALMRSPEAPDPRFLAALCQTLHVANYRNLSVPGCALFLDHDPRENRRLRAAMVNADRRACALGEAAVEGDQLVCRIGKGVVLSGPVLAALEELRRVGVRMAFGLFDGVSQSGEAQPKFRPDIVEVRGAWLSGMARERAASKLVKALAEAWQGDGARIFAQGISSADELRLALDIGADYLAGDHLGEAISAGAVMDDEPKPIASLVAGRQRRESHSA